MAFCCLVDGVVDGKDRQGEAEKRRWTAIRCLVDGVIEGKDRQDETEKRGLTAVIIQTSRAGAIRINPKTEVVQVQASPGK